MRLNLFYLIGALSLFIGAPVQARVDEITDFASAHVKARNISIWVPDDYGRTRDRLPVIYMHDGQNIFEPGRAYGGKEWGIDEALTKMKRRVIVVGVWNTNLRGREYLPAKVASRLPEAARQRVEGIHGGPSFADGYLRFLVKELKPHIDKTYRTRKGPRDTSIMGSSMGGLISLYALGEYPQVFGNAAALSIHWPLAAPRTVESDVAEVTVAFADWLATTKVRPGRNRFYTDHGTINLDSFYRPYSTQMDKVFETSGWKRDKNWVSRVFEGTDHNEAAWRERVEIPLEFLLQPSR